jgi:ribosomal protein S18 acetylase RimI-like enzyme
MSTTPDPMILTPFTPGDYDESLALWRRCEGMGLSGADSRESIAAYLERNPGVSLVARERGALVGTILGGHDGRRGYLHHLAVDPAHRRRGIGSRLLEACLGTLRLQGIQKCHLFIYVDNEAARGFWERRGWTYRLDIAVMSVELTSPAGGPL